MNKYWLSALACTLAINADAQQKVLTAKDYENAESFMSYNTSKYITHSFSQPHWLEGDKFWYTIKTADAEQTFLVNPVNKTKTLTTAYQNTNSQNHSDYSDPNEVISPDGKKSILIKRER